MVAALTAPALCRAASMNHSRSVASVKLRESPPAETVTAPPCRSIAYDERSISSALVPFSPGSTSWHAAVVDVVVTDSAAAAARNDRAPPPASRSSSAPTSHAEPARHRSARLSRPPLRRRCRYSDRLILAVRCLTPAQERASGVATLVVAPWSRVRWLAVADQGPAPAGLSARVWMS